ncbi:hypothetical protein PCH_Pc22g01950 [Penicillium rubens Wisconsin 54-1255]|uniref:Uncharacterized protein n=1 Tax=Penicillium rubens (strain ATCC 28089 / DSM 1075 / NRRL 1951 / Wisconsin 54-1255) TaxID=500485 RepID=B6HP47_PENRW|nr:hypothetical protein PCH_Pc22g01950 [Penicillium rubens Wisconsin 54-1255]
MGRKGELFFGTDVESWKTAVCAVLVTANSTYLPKASEKCVGTNDQYGSERMAYFLGANEGWVSRKVRLLARGIHRRDEMGKVYVSSAVAGQSITSSGQLLYNHVLSGSYLGHARSGDFSLARGPIALLAADLVRITRT